MSDRRRIIIALGERTTETHCGDCPGMAHYGDGAYCHRGTKPTLLAYDSTGFIRLPECRAAELPASPSGCTCTTQLRNGDARVLDRRCPSHGDRPRLTLMPGAKGWARD